MGRFFAEVFSRLGRLWRRLFAGKGSAQARLGRFGEDRAVRFLRRMGCKILARNWTHGHGEIDVVALDGNGVLVFVEVRLRAADALVSGYFSIGKSKRAVLRRTCDAYRRRFADPCVPFRFDVVEIRMGAVERAVDLRHYENVPLFFGHSRWGP
jgi:putative endonuclease